ncbi:MAG: acyltransferase family protein [Eubacteriales bacterium]|nr:acyltransferase family protein [Eubacteriales bacterium]
MKSERIDWIDTAKGIGIILVVFSHLTTDGQFLRNFIFSFHMPLFFFLSGFLSVRSGKAKKYSFREYLLRRIKRLYVPYFICLVLDHLAARLVPTLANYEPNLTHFLRNMIAMDLKYLVNGPIWFLVVMFYLNLVFFFLLKLPRKRLYPVFCLFVLGTAFLTRDLPFGLGYIFHGGAFFLLGYFFNPVYKQQAGRGRSAFSIPAIPVCAVLLSIGCTRNSMVDLHWFQYGNFYLYYLNALLGIALTILVSIQLKKLRLFQYLGRNSEVILCLHYPFTRILMPKIFLLLGLSEYLYHPVTESILTILILCCIACVIEVYGRIKAAGIIKKTALK